MALLDSFLDEFPLHPSLRIPPLLDPSPDFTTKSALPSPLEPNARLNLNLDTVKLTGRKKALAEAKAIGEPTKSTELRPIQRGPRKRQKLQEYERIADFVQLPEPKSTAKNEKPRPFQPVSVLNELHEPPPSAALFPPITPNKWDNRHSDSLSSLSLIEDIHDEDETSLANDVVQQKKDSQSQKRTFQRPRTKWTTLETEQLRKGIEIYGVGKWKKILNHPGFSFQLGRTPVDLKDHHRTKLKAQSTKKMLGSSRSGAVDTNNASADNFLNPTQSPTPEGHRGSTQSDSTLSSGSIRKGTWTDVEDENLEKGYRKYGFSWTRIAKDPELDLAHRTGPQVRDRFRTKFPSLYSEDTKQNPRPANENRGQQDRQPGLVNGAWQGGHPSSVKGSELHRSSSRDNGSESDHHDMSIDPTATISPQRPSAASSSAYNILGLLNSDGEDDRPSSELPLDTWDTNVTLPPLLWEDMAARPMFDLE